MSKHMDTRQQHASGLRFALAAALLALVVMGVLLAVFVVRSKKETSMERQGASSEQTSVAEQREGQSSGAGQTSATSAPASELARMLRDHEVGSIRLVGDSITAGYGTDGYEDANLTETGAVIFDDGASTVYYETPETAVSWANAFRSYALQQGVKDFVNAGINGAFMMELAENPDAWLADGADVIFVALGTNDAGYYGPGEYREAAEQALAAAAEKSKLLVVLAPVCDLRPESMLVEPASDLGDILADICQQNGYVFVDPREAVTPDMFNDDGLHPTSEGSLAIWQCIKTTLGL